MQLRYGEASSAAGFPVCGADMVATSPAATTRDKLSLLSQYCKE